MTYQAMATVTTPHDAHTYVSGWLESSEKAYDELGALMYGRMPSGTFNVTLKIKSNNNFKIY